MDAREELLRRIRRRVGDPRVAAAVAAIPREPFLPESLRGRAWANEPHPIGGGQTISQPLLVAHMCDLLALRGHERVLDVGTGSGYHAAVLSRLAARVVSIERDPALSAGAARNLAAAGVTGVELVVGDGSCGHPPAAPYDAINVAAASADDVPPALVEQLADGGRLLLPVAGTDQRLVLVRRHGDRVERRPLDPVRFVPLIPGAPGD